MTLALIRPRLVPILSVLAAALLAAYVALMIAAILFAALQTQLAQDMQATHMEIAKLETAYFASVTRLDTTDPRALGYVTPTRVEYVTAATLPNLTLAR